MPQTSTPPPSTPQQSPDVAVRVDGPHVMTVASMPLDPQHATPEAIAAMHEAIRRAERAAIAEAKAKHGQPS